MTSSKIIILKKWYGISNSIVVYVFIMEIQTHNHHQCIDFFSVSKSDGRCDQSSEDAHSSIALGPTSFFWFCFEFSFGIFWKRHNRGSPKSLEYKSNFIDKIWKDLIMFCDLRQILISICIVLLFGALLHVKIRSKHLYHLFVQNCMNCKYSDFKLSVSYSIFYLFS